MAFAQGSRHGISFVPEVTYGTTPGTPAMKNFRNTGASLNMTKESFQSQEIRADRMIADFRHGTKSIAGGIPFEFSYGAFDDWLESALFGAWSTDVLKAGVTPKSFSVERRFADIAQYLVYTGVMVNTLDLTIPASGIITGSMDMVGKNLSVSGTSLGTPTDVATNAPLSADTGTLTEGGGAIAIVTELTLNLQNGISPNFVIGSNVSQQLTYGRSNLTGTMTAFFEDASLLNKFINETESSLQIDLTDGTNSYEILIPRLKYTGGEIPLDGEGSIQMSLPFQALYDSVTGTNFQITR